MYFYNQLTVYRGQILRYCIQQNNTKLRWLRQWTHTSHPIAHPHGWAMGCFLWILERRSPRDIRSALYYDQHKAQQTIDISYYPCPLGPKGIVVAVLSVRQSFEVYLPATPLTFWWLNTCISIIDLIPMWCSHWCCHEEEPAILIIARLWQYFSLYVWGFMPYSNVGLSIITFAVGLAD